MRFLNLQFQREMGGPPTLPSRGAVLFPGFRIQDSGPDLTPSPLSLASAITGWMRLNTPVSALAR